MSRLKILCTLFPLLLTCFSCQTNEEKRKALNDRFLAKFGSMNFNVFKYKSLLVRDFLNNNPIILVFDDTINGSTPCRLGYRVVVDSKKHIVISSNKIAPDSCQVNEEALKALAVQFNKLDIFYLSVDSNNNVHVSTDFQEGKPDLVRFSDTMLITPEYMHDWEAKGNNWFERNKFDYK